MSIVVILVGILAVGVLKGVNLVKASRLANARSVTARSAVPSIPGLVAWYETSLKESLKENEAIDGNQPTEWRDISPNSIIGQKNKLTKSAGADVTYQLNGINKSPSLQFSGTGKFSLSSFYQGTSTQATVFLVLRPLTAPSPTAQILLDSYVANATTSIGIKIDSVNLNAGSNVSTGTGVSPAIFTVGNNYVVAAYLNSSASGAYVNNAATLAGNSYISAGPNPINGLTIGTDKTGAAGFAGLISEVIIYNRPLKIQERKDVMNYLSRKYGIAVTGL